MPTITTNQPNENERDLWLGRIARALEDLRGGDVARGGSRHEDDSEESPKSRR